MDEPRLLIDETSNELERALLRAGRSVEGSSVRRMKVLASLGVGVAVASSSKASWAMAAGWKKALTAGAIAASGVAGVAVYLNASPPAQQAPASRQVAEVSRSVVEQSESVRVASRVDLEADPAERTSDVVERSVAARATEPSNAGSANAIDSVEDSTEVDSNDDGAEAQQPSAPARVVPKPVAKVRQRRSVPKVTAKSVEVPETPEAPSRVDESSSLQDEIALLDRARSDLHSGRSREALALLSDYSSRFPGGSLRMEAEVLRIEALAASGRKTEASRRARRMLGRSPNSVVAARLRRYVIE